MGLTIDVRLTVYRVGEKHLIAQTHSPRRSETTGALFISAGENRLTCWFSRLTCAHHQLRSVVPCRELTVAMEIHRDQR